MTIPYIELTLWNDPQAYSFQMVKKGDQLSGMKLARELSTGIGVQVCNSPFRATGIKASLSHRGTLKKAQQIARRESPRTTKLYDQAMEFRWMRLNGD